MTVGLLTLAADRTILSWDTHAEHLTGYKAEIFQTLSLSQLLTPDDVVQDLIHQALLGVPSLGQSLQLHHATDRVIPVEVQCTPLRAPGQTIACVALAFQELEPLQVLRRHEARLTLLGRLAGTLSHEIRTPLHAIVLHADVLEEELRQPTPDSYEQVQESLATIKSEITRLNDLVQQYFALARLADLPRESTPLSAVLENVRLEMQTPLARRGIALHLEGFDTLGYARSHQTTFRRALLNLIQHVQESMPPGSTLTLRCRQESAHVYLEIEDNGPGLTPEQVALWSMPLPSTNLEALGLELYVAREIIEAHAGTLSVSSIPGQGTTIRITLPHCPPLASAQA